MQKQSQDIEVQNNGNQQRTGSLESLANDVPEEIEHATTHERNTWDDEDTNRDPSPMLTDGAGIRYSYLTNGKSSSG